MAFDPDHYLASKKSSGFDPDSYLESKGVSPQSTDSAESKPLMRRMAESVIDSPALPIAGSVIGGVMGAPTGPGAMATAALGGAAGESYRQLAARYFGLKSPKTSTEAAKDISIEGATSAIGEGSGRLLASGGKAALKMFPRVAESFSGTPSKNIAKALKRGADTYFPKVAKGFTREQAGKALGEVEENLLNKLFKPQEKVAIDLNNKGFANKLIEKAAMKIEEGGQLSPKEALGVRRAIDVAFPADTAKSAGLRARLSNLRANAREVIAKEIPELDKALKRSEATILKSQLSKPLRVNRTNPDQFSGLSGTLLPLAGAITGYKTENIAPLLGGVAATSPLAFGATAATIGTIRNATNPIARKALQRSLVQSAARGISGAFKRKKD